MKNKNYSVEIYSDLKKLISDGQEWLVKNESHDNLIVGLINSLDKKLIECKKPLLLGLFKGDEIKGLVIQTPPNFILLSHLDDEALKELCVFLIQNSFKLPGARGPVEVMNQFSQMWQQYAGCQSQTIYSHKIYELTEVTPPTPVVGQLQLANQADFSVVRKWLEQFYGQALGGHDKELYDVEETAHRKIRNKELYLWEVQGVPVAMAGVVGSTENGVRISNVYTPKEQRGKGYASNCVAALANKMINSSFTKCYLYADEKNNVSNSMYQRIGFKSIGEATSVRFF
jgi:predicted GNAT family acetyltransferase